MKVRLTSLSLPPTLLSLSTPQIPYSLPLSTFIPASKPDYLFWIYCCMDFPPILLPFSSLPFPPLSPFSFPSPLPSFSPPLPSSFSSPPLPLPPSPLPSRSPPSPFPSFYPLPPPPLLPLLLPPPLPPSLGWYWHQARDASGGGGSLCLSRGHDSGDDHRAWFWGTEVRAWHDAKGMGAWHINPWPGPHLLFSFVLFSEPALLPPPLQILENVEHCGGEPKQAETGTVLYHWCITINPPPCTSIHHSQGGLKVLFLKKRSNEKICSAYIHNHNAYGHSNRYSCFWSGVFAGIDGGGWVLSNLETKYFYTKHYSSLTPYTTS